MSIHIADEDEQYKQYGCSDHSEEIIKDLAQMKYYDSKIFY